jgi:hypothetical protein
MMLTLFVAFLALSVSSASSRLIGSDPLTWSPRVVPNKTETPDKCSACRVMVNFVENTQKIYTVVPKNLETLCNEIVQQYPPDVLCNDLCTKTTTYEITL